MGTAGLRSLAIDFPRVVRTNNFWRERYPDIVRNASDRSLARLWEPVPGRAPSGTDIFDEEMAPYTEDAFRGTVERRVLGTGEKVIDVEKRAARAALRAANLSPADVDLLICATFVSDHIGIGHAAFLSRDLELGGTSWNLETACASATEALRTAAALVRAGEHRHVLVVTSCMYSKVSDPRDTLTWFLGDGAAAFVVSEVEAAGAVIGSYFTHTGDTCGSIYYELSEDPATPRVCVRSDRASGKLLRENSPRYLRESVAGALSRSKLSLNDINFFVFNTPTAWYARFAVRALGVDPAKTISTYPTYANMGPVLMPANLYHAAAEGRIRKGDLVLLYSIGSVSSAGAVVIRWGDVALGPTPTPAEQRE
jgi:3-oxoacyl-[acyl-carrier-protein] synthase-3